MADQGSGAGDGGWGPPPGTGPPRPPPGPPPASGPWTNPPPATAAGYPHVGPYGTPYGAQPQRDKGAVRSLVLGIVGLVFCPLIFSTGAVIEGVQCRKRIRESQGWLNGNELATAGLVLGIIGLCLMPVWYLLVFSSS